MGGILTLLGVAATVKPVLSWVQPRVHYLVYAMDDPRLEMIGQVSDSLASSSPAESMLATITQTIARTVNLPYVKLETNEGATSIRMACFLMGTKQYVFQLPIVRGNRWMVGCHISLTK